MLSTEPLIHMAPRRDFGFDPTNPCFRMGVHELQSFLAMPAAEIDGIYGPVTRRRVQAYQRAHGLAQGQIPDKAMLSSFPEADAERIIAHCAESAQCLATGGVRESGGSDEARGEGSIGGGVPPTVNAGLLSSIPWWGWAGGAAVLAAGGALVAGYYSKKGRRRG